MLKLKQSDQTKRQPNIFMFSFVYQLILVFVLFYCCSAKTWRIRQREVWSTNYFFLLFWWILLCCSGYMSLAPCSGHSIRHLVHSEIITSPKVQVENTHYLLTLIVWELSGEGALVTYNLTCQGSSCASKLQRENTEGTNLICFLAFILHHLVFSVTCGYFRVLGQKTLVPGTSKAVLKILPVCLRALLSLFNPSSPRVTEGISSAVIVSGFALPPRIASLSAAAESVRPCFFCVPGLQSHGVAMVQVWWRRCSKHKGLWS